MICMYVCINTCTQFFDCSFSSCSYPCILSTDLQLQCIRWTQPNVIAPCYPSRAIPSLKTLESSSIFLCFELSSLNSPQSWVCESSLRNFYYKAGGIVTYTSRICLLWKGRCSQLEGVYSGCKRSWMDSTKEGYQGTFSNTVVKPG